MPDIDGIEVMRQLRERRPVAVILLTAKAPRPTRRWVSTSELMTTSPSHSTLMNLPRVFERSCARSSGAQPGAGILAFDDVEIDLERRMVTRDGELVAAVADRVAAAATSRGERGQGRVAHRAPTKVWGPEYRDDLQYLRVWVSRVRRSWAPSPVSRAGSEHSRGSDICSTSSRLPRSASNPSRSSIRRRRSSADLGTTGSRACFRRSGPSRRVIERFANM